MLNFYLFPPCDKEQITGSFSGWEKTGQWYKETFGSKADVPYLVSVGGHTSQIHQAVYLRSGHFVCVIFSSIKK